MAGESNKIKLDKALKLKLITLASTISLALLTGSVTDIGAIRMALKEIDELLAARDERLNG